MLSKSSKIMNWLKNHRFLDKFLLLIWKNWTLLKRRPIHSLFEILYPVIVIVILVYVKSLITVTRKDAKIYDSFYLFGAFSPSTTIAYSPRTMGPLFFDKLCDSSSSKCVGFDSAAEMNTAIDNYAVNLTAGLQFDDSFNGTIPSNLNVVIRLPSSYFSNQKSVWFTNVLFPRFQTPGPRSENNSAGGPPYYFSRNFLNIQSTIVTTLIRNYDRYASLPDIRVNRFPHASWLDDLFYNSQMSIMVSLIIMMCFMYNYINTIRAITSEKEMQLKESMKIMGLPGWLHWLAWFLRTFIILLIAIILMTIVLKVRFTETAIFNKSDGSVLFVFLLLFSCSTITFSFLISVFFSKANTAAAVGSLVFFLTYLPYSLLQQSSDNLSTGAILGSSILCNSALSFGLTEILKFEAIEEGLHWSNLFSTVSADDTLTVGYIFLVLIADIFLYLILALYIEAIFPGDFGVPKPWYFPLMKSYWCNETLYDIDEGVCNNTTISAEEQKNYEQFTEKLPTGIQLKNLGKIFGTNSAVNNLNLDMYEGHITVLLGHNGAGKTTTMSMITGMFPPSKGTAIVGGYDVRTSIDQVRDSMGLCLQHNVLFDSLTVWEHLYFFGRLKGLAKNEINQEIDAYIELLELEDKKNAPSKTLSGGMKRKLSVGMALCGKSKVVMLDEPTAGMDPSARRAIWNVLQKQKYGRTILLTTHFMDEADLLGDRIAIMTGGQLQCCGSSYFLKKRYGAGYYLIMDVTPQCQPSEVTKLLQKFIPYVKIFSQVGSELTYQLPENESIIFEPMLYELENNNNKLGIQSYGVSLTTMEEVFMKVGADHDNKLSENFKNSHQSEVTVEQNIFKNFNLDYLDGIPLLRNQFIAIFLKKVYAFVRTWHLFIFQFFLPIILLIITILNARSYVQDITFPSLKITLSSYNDPITVISGVNTNSTNFNYSKIYRDSIKEFAQEETENITIALLKKTADFPSIAKSQYVVGAEFFDDDDSVTAWFNGDPYHAIPLSVSLLLNTIYKAYFGSDKSITFYNHPLPLGVEAQLNDLEFNLIAYQIAAQLGFGMAFATSFYVIFCIKERVSKAKHLQFVSGTNVLIFWGTSYICDMITFLVTMCGTLITLVALQEDGFKTGEDLSRVALVFVYFGFNVLPFIYLASYLFSVPSSGFSRMVLLGTLTGILGITVMQVLEIESLDLMYVARPLHWVLLFIPFYTVSKGISDLGSISTLRQTCLQVFQTLDGACAAFSQCCNLEDYYSMGTPGIGRNIIISFLMAIILFIVLVINEYGLFSYIRNKMLNYKQPPHDDDSLDIDVREENQKIRNEISHGFIQEYALTLCDVSKYYKNFLAVNRLCLGVKPYECFGLLGVNGAGKTSTFKMMTGDEHISYGEAFVNGHRIKTEQKKVQKLIGYCPQFDALLDDLTVKETLQIFALIRGVPFGECKVLGENLAHEFDFFKHIGKQIKELSGGNKRKLSTALALIGDPPVIYLDEPTTGMDPATKRYLWTSLNKLRDNGKCIILTSHSMEECEALCTRIAIMVNGTFQCLGSSQRLKNKFAQGFSLMIKLRKIDSHDILEEEVAAINDFIQKSFPGAELKEKYQELLTYQLVNNSIPWSRMFGILESSKKELHIEDYSLGQCSLEQVFLSFTKYQKLLE